jgi:hypothetical protein
MRAERGLSLALLLVLAATLPLGAGANGGSGPGVAGGSEADVVGGSQPAAIDVTTGGGGGVSVGDGARIATPTADEARTVTLDVQLLGSGHANWTVATYVPLDGSDDREAFETLGQRYVNDTADVAIDADLFRSRVAAARTAAGRSMSIPGESVERDWRVEDGTGVLVLEFTWRRFARAEDDRLVVDDAFETTDGTWLPRLERGQVLVVRPPEGVGFVETPRGKGVTNGTLQWTGPVTFGDDYFRIVYRTNEDESSPTTTTTAGTTARSATTTEPPPDSPSMGALVLVVLLGGGGAAAYLWLRRGGDEVEEAPAPADDGPVDGVATDGSDATVADPEGSQPSADEADDGPTEPTPDDPFAGVDVEMLSDEERVLRLLDANGGRMKQARIVKETDWSNAKVSQLLSRMDDDDTIDKLRIGRENLISIPDVDVDSFEE